MQGEAETNSADKEEQEDFLPPKCLLIKNFFHVAKCTSRENKMDNWERNILLNVKFHYLHKNYIFGNKFSSLLQIIYEFLEEGRLIITHSKKGHPFIQECSEETEAL